MGTVVKISGSNGTRYRAQVGRQGHSQQSENFGRKKDADAWIRKIESEIDSGRFLFDGQAKKRAVNELIDRYVLDFVESKRSARDQ